LASSMRDTRNRPRHVGQSLAKLVRCAIARASAGVSERFVSGLQKTAFVTRYGIKCCELTFITPTDGAVYLE
jgi:hypothetical protein